ncbi:hypothetical protein JHK82_024493 [Glycine max]|nr:hypothetical protein JHK85_025092 [Glycine max]KAG5012330.1 hypothetical protein JHK86_024591 [Glycine max]KAG5133305.1 hypothetical protein JHK82_024493 [Glycine max]
MPPSLTQLMHSLPYSARALTPSLTHRSSKVSHVCHTVVVCHNLYKVEVPNHELGSSNDSTDISTPLTNDLGVYNQISSNQNTGYGPCLSTVRPTNIHPQVYRAKAKSQMKMQETVVGEINFDDDSAKKVIMVVVEYAKTYPRFEENYKFISRELTILNRYY